MAARAVARWLRRAGRWLLTLLFSLVVLSCALTQTDPGRDLLLRSLTPLGQGALAGRLSVGRLEGDLIRGLLLADIALRDAEGEVAISARRLELRYDLLALLSGGVAIESVRVEGALVQARYLRDGRINLTALLAAPAAPASPAPPGAAPLRIRIGHALLDAEVRCDLPRQIPHRIAARVVLQGSAYLAGSEINARLQGLDVTLLQPTPAHLTLQGQAQRKAGERFSVRDVKLALQADGPGLSRLLPLPALPGLPGGLIGTWGLELRADGPDSALDARLRLLPPRGSLAVNARIDVPALLRGARPEAAERERRAGWRGDLEIRGVDPAAAWGGAPAAEVQGEAAFSGGVQVDALELRRFVVRVAGVAATLRGRLAQDGGQEAWVDLAVPDLARAARAARAIVPGLPPLPQIAGSLRASAHVARTAAGRVLADGSALGEALQIDKVQIGQLELAARARDLRSGEASLVVRAARAPGAPPLDELRAVVQGGLAGASLHLGLRAGQTALDLSASGAPLRGRGGGVTGLDASLEALSLSHGARRVALDGPARVRVRDRDRVEIDELALTAGAQRLALRGRASLRERLLDVALAARRLDLAELAPLAAQLSGAGSAPAVPRTSLDLDLHLTGTAAAPVLDLQLQGTSAAHRVLPAMQHLLTARYGGDGVHGALASAPQAGAGGPRINASVDLPIPRDAPLRGKLVIDGVSLAELQDALQPGPAPLSLQGAARLEVTAGGTQAQPRLDAALRLSRWGVASLRGDRLLVKVGYGGGGLDAGLDVAFGPAPLSGALAGDLKVRGTKERPELEGDLRFSGLRLADRDEAIGDLRLRASGTFDGAAGVGRLTLGQARGGALDVSAQVPVDPRKDWRIGVQARGLDLSFLPALAPALQELRALLNGDVLLSGTRERPRVAGRMRVDGGALRLSDSSLSYHDLLLDLSAKEDGSAQAQVAAKSRGGSMGDRLTLLTRGSKDGWLRASVRATLAGLVPARLDGTIEASHLPVSDGGVSAWLDTRVRLSGTREGQVLAGTATIERGDLHLTRTESQPDLHPTGPLKDVVFVDKEAQRERRRREAGQPGGGAAPLGPVPATRVKLRLPGPFHVRGPELDVELQGELDAEVVDGQARVLGTVGASKGWVEITGRRYALLRANASFDGAADINPALDIRLEREVKNATLVIKIKGTARSPRIEMRAEPPIYDQSQVLTMILSGESGHEDQGEQAVEKKLVNAVANTLTSALIGQIRKGLGGYLPVEVIKVDLGFQGSNVVQPRVEVGKYILNRLYLSYVYQFGAQVGARRANTHEAHLDLSILQNLSLLTLFGDAAVGAVKLYWTRRF